VSQQTDSWRGVATEEEDEVDANLSAFMRKRSRRLLSEIIAPERGSIALGAVLVVLNALANLTPPYIIGLAIDKGITPFVHGGARQGGSLRVFYAICAAYVVVRIVETLTLRGFLRVTGLVGERILFDLRTRVYDHLQRLSIAFFERYTSGRVMSRLTNDIDAIAELFLTGLVSLPVAAVQLVVITALLLILDLPLALVVLGVFPFVVLLTRWFRKRSEVVYRKIRDAVTLVYIQFTETLGGIRAVHAYRREPRNQEIFEDIDARYRDANMEAIRAQSIYGPGVSFLGDVATFGVVLYGGFRVINGDVQIGVLVSFFLYLRMFFQPIQELSQVFNVFQAAGSALEKLSGLLDEQPGVPEPAPDRAVSHQSWGGRVEFADVTFGYRERNVLENVSLVVPAGQTIALVGPTGAGKSTTARLVARFYDPNAGSVLLDGEDLRDLTTADLRKAIIMVTQENFLFSGTVGENIAFGKPTATAEEIERAARTVGAHPFIAALPEGYDTDIQKRGGRLSAGQRQLVALARAFLADPAVIIFDEATSSIDMPSERLIQQALEVVLQDRTAFIIAHRLATVEIADRVLVIDEGKVVEDGSPIELLRQDGRWARLHEAWEESLA
jgi:ABC-type multidrug transport system fused ATPase/permease subunit